MNNVVVLNILWLWVDEVNWLNSARDRFCSFDQRFDQSNVIARFGTYFHAAVTAIVFCWVLSDDLFIILRIDFKSFWIEDLREFLNIARRRLYDGEECRRDIPVMPRDEDVSQNRPCSVASVLAVYEYLRWWNRRNMRHKSVRVGKLAAKRRVDVGDP